MVKNKPQNIWSNITICSITFAGGAGGAGGGEGTGRGGEGTGLGAFLL